MSYLNILSSVDIFTDLSEEQLEKVEKLCSLKRFEQGEVVFEENSPSKEFYVIAQGSVDVQLDPDLIRKSDDKHEPKTIVTLKKGQSFGEVALVDQGVRSASVIASSEAAEVLEISREAFMELMKNDLEIGFLVMQNFRGQKILRMLLKKYRVLQYPSVQGHPKMDSCIPYTTRKLFLMTVYYI